MSSHRQIVFALLLGLAAVFGAASRAAAAPIPSPPSTAVVAAGPVFAAGVSWYGFKKYWLGFVKNSDRVVVIVALVAAAALFIITRGKWMH